MTIQEITFTSRSVNILFLFLLFCLLVTCRSKTPHSSKSVEITELEEFKTIVTFGETALTTPNIIRYDGNSNLFVYDEGQKKVLQLDSTGSINNEYGRGGRGPGEFLLVNNIFLTDSYLYVVDQILFRISRFDLGGDLESSLDYGRGNSQAMPPPAPVAPVPQARDINNQPFVTPRGNVLLSTIRPDVTPAKLYELVDWEGKPVSKIGEVIDGSSFQLDYDRYHADIADQNVPAYYRSNVFPLNDIASPGELYLIYNAFPKIVKYNTSGEKLWETDIYQTPELDFLITHFFDVSAQMDGYERIALLTYVSGVSDEEGHLYLALGKYSDFPNELWIHEFNSEGELIQRYKLLSEDVNLVPIFDVDFSRKRIFVVTEEAEIRAYSF